MHSNNARGTIFTYHDGQQELEGYLARPASTAAHAPVVLVVHAWGGQDDFARAKADMIASLGYIGFAIDVYGKGRRGNSPEENSKLMTPWVENRGALRVLGWSMEERAARIAELEREIGGLSRAARRSSRAAAASPLSMRARAASHACLLGRACVARCSPST